jgi:beta-glucosidase
MRTAIFLVGSVALGSSVAGCGSSSPDASVPAASGGTGQVGGSAQTNNGTNLGGGANPAGGSGNAPSSGGSGPSAGGSGTAVNGGRASIGGSNVVGGNTSQTGGTTGTTGGSASGGAGATTAGGSTAQASGGSSTSGGTTQSVGGASPSGGSASTCAAPPTLPVSANAWRPSATCLSLAQSKRATMSAAQKAAQILIAEHPSVTNSGITSNHYGAIFAGGQSDPGGMTANNSATAWRDLVNANHTAAGSDWPLLWGIDAVHGNNNVLNATMFPHNIGLGCTRDPELLKQVGRITALEMRGTGINWTFAPTISAALDERWGRTFESFSEDPAVDAWLGKAVVEGLQQGNLKNKQSVAACAKHFAGDGATQNGVDKADVTLDSATFQKLCVDQYQPLINYGVATVMISYSKYKGTSVSADTALVTTKLRQEMGFSGIVVSDYNAVLKLPGGNTPDAFGNALPSDQQIASAMNAGLDMLMIAQSTNVTATLASLTSRAGGAIEQSRIDDAVDRILTVKCEMGMWDNYSAAADGALTSQVGSTEHRAVAQQAVRESLVVLKNEGNALPLSKTANILVAGTGADSISKQCGGWTVDWQGLANGTTMSTATTTQGTTILAGMKTLNSTVTYNQSGSGTGDIGVVVVGESPYAEEYGDATDLTLKARSATDDAVLTTMLGKGIPIVLVILSGRPLIIDSYMNNANLKAVVAAWLPGSEGQGVADVLFGDYKPTGKLGHSWPKSMSQIPINQSDSTYQSDPPLYPVCHGLTW